MIKNGEETSTFVFSSVFVSPDVNKGIISKSNDIYSLFMMFIYISHEKIPNEKGIKFAESMSKQFPISDLIIVYYNNFYLQINIDISIIQNDPDILFYIGEIYIMEKYGIQNINKSIHYYSLAANQNHPEAQFILGLIYYEGEYIERDINKSIYYLSLAANQNHPDAQNNLGAIYYEGKYIERDINKSIYYYSLAANQNLREAQFNLGLIYYEGKYIERDINKSIHYYSLAANQNLREAQFNLGLIYYEGKDVPKDIKKGQYHIIQSSKNGLIQGNFSHGFLLHEGRFIERNIKEAIHYYKEASSFNNQYAKNNLGIFYKNEYLGTSIEYFEEAIRQKNDYLSMYNLAHIYIYNESIELQDIDNPIKLLIKSSNEFEYSLFLLCLILIKRIGFDVTKFEKEIAKFSDIQNSIKSKILQAIYLFDLFDKFKFDFYYEQFKKIDFLYNIELKPIISSSLEYIKTELNILKYPNAKDITSDFYEGFGKELFETI